MWRMHCHSNSTSKPGKRGIANWNVDLTDPMRILTVKTEGISAEEITAVLKTAGYQAELISAE